MDTITIQNRKLDYELEEEGGRWAWTLHEAGEMLASGMWFDDRIECIKNLSDYLNGISGKDQGEENEKQIRFSILKKSGKAA